MGCSWEVPGARDGKGGRHAGSAKVYECLHRSLWTGFGLLPAARRPCGGGDREKPFDQLVSERHVDLGAGGLGFNKQSGCRKGVSFSSKGASLGQRMKREEQKHR